MEPHSLSKDPMEPHKGWAMMPHNSVVYRDGTELWRSNTLNTIHAIRAKMIKIFQEYPDLHEEMIMEKKDASLLTLYKSMQPTPATVCVKETVSKATPTKTYNTQGKAVFLYPHY